MKRFQAPYSILPRFRVSTASTTTTTTVSSSASAVAYNFNQTFSSSSSSSSSQQQKYQYQQQNQSSWSKSSAAAGFSIASLLAAAATTTAFCYGGPSGQSHVQHPAYPPQHQDDEDASLPIISLEEVKKHTSPDSIWVTYNGFVYDVTGFANQHPGGRELLLTAAGLDLEHFFSNYKVHTKTDKAINFLNGMKIGKLSEADSRKARNLATPQAHIDSRMKVLSKARSRFVFGVLALAPLLMLARFLIRVIGFFVPPVGDALAGLLPVSVPGYGDAKRVPSVKSNGEKTRVAVIGGGIAGCGAAYALSQSGYDVTVYEARKNLSGNAHTFDWNINTTNDSAADEIRKTCVSVTAWPANLYKNYDALLKQLKVETAPQYLSWFLNSKVPGSDGFLWAADPSAPEGSLRKRFQSDFDNYGRAVSFINFFTKMFTFSWFQEDSMYSLQTGLGPLNPFATFPLHHTARIFGVSQDWWDIVFTPHYTASFLTDKLDNMVSVTGPIMEDTIPLNPRPQCATENRLTTCETWKNAGDGIREVFRKLTSNCAVKLNTRVTDLEINNKTGEHFITDDAGGHENYDRVIFACPSNAVGNILKDHNWIEDAIFAIPEYADDHHPGTGHMHAVMHNDSSIIDPKYRDEVLRRGSNYVEITKSSDGSINIENTYNFGVQTPSLVYKAERPPLLITHALGEGKSIDPDKIIGDGNHVRAHPLYSGWNVAALLGLRFAQGRRGVYYCSNYTTPGNCHDMSLLSGLHCAYAIGADYPFEGNAEAVKDFSRLGLLMGLN